MRRSDLPVASVVAVNDLKLDRVERAGRRIELISKEFGLLGSRKPPYAQTLRLH
jgi:hypothetical protein